MAEGKRYEILVQGCHDEPSEKPLRDTVEAVVAGLEKAGFLVESAYLDAEYGVASEADLFKARTVAPVIQYRHLERAAAETAEQAAAAEETQAETTEGDVEPNAGEPTVVEPAPFSGAPVEPEPEEPKPFVGMPLDPEPPAED